MPIPGQHFKILDPGLAVTPEAINAPLFFGCCTKGTVNKLYALGRVSDAADQLGEGPLAEDLCSYLALAGGPAYAVPLAFTTKGAIGTVTKTPAATPPSTGTMTVTAVDAAKGVYDAYELIVEITVTGDLGDAEFRYSLDDGYSYSASMTIPSGGLYTVPNTGLKLTFTGTPSGTPPNVIHPFQALDKWECDCSMPYYGATELAAGVQAAIASSVEVAFLVLSGTFPTADQASVLAAAAGAHAQYMFTMYRFVRVLTHAGTETDPVDVNDEFKDLGDTRVGVAFSFCDQVSNKPFIGWGVPRRPSVGIVAVRAGQASISEDLGRVASGALTGVVAIEHDEFRNEIMDQKRFITLRTFQGLGGYYITNGRLMSPAGSDYKYWQHGRCMDRACDVTYKAQIPIINKSVRVNPDGTISDRDARSSEAHVQSALDGALMDPNNAEGTKGHVSAVEYKIDRTNNVLGTETIKTNVAIRPLGYAKTINTELGFSASAGGG